MKVLHREIEMCEMCPYLVSSGFGTKYSCAETRNIVEDITKIPPFCPLPAKSPIRNKGGNVRKKEKPIKAIMRCGRAAGKVTALCQEMYRKGIEGVKTMTKKQINDLLTILSDLKEIQSISNSVGLSSQINPDYIVYCIKTLTTILLEHVSTHADSNIGWNDEVGDDGGGQD